MKVVCIIPVKLNSERVPGKNFRMLNGKKLYMHIVEHAMQANVFDDIFVDTNSDELAEYARGLGIGVIERIPELAANTANGNDLLLYEKKLYPDYDYYFQLFATAPFLQPESIKACVDKLMTSNEFDSCFTAVKHNGFYWFNRNPVNYRPCLLPRSQDMEPLYEETTGLYGISAASLERYRSRIGRNPYIHIVSKYEAVDINTEEDFRIAQCVGNEIYGMK